MAEASPPPPGLTYNSYRTWRSSNIGRSTAEELSRGWAEYRQGSRLSPIRASRLSPIRASRLSPPKSTKLSPTTTLRMSRPGLLARSGISGLPTDLLNTVLRLARLPNTTMGDLLRFCSADKRMLLLCRQDSIWRSIFEARHGQQSSELPARVIIPCSGSGGGSTTLDLRICSVQYGDTTIPSWRIWLRLLEKELPRRDIPITITLVPTTKEVKRLDAPRINRMAGGATHEQVYYSLEEVNRELQTRFEEDITHTRDGLLRNYVRHISVPTPASVAEAEELASSKFKYDVEKHLTGLQDIDMPEIGIVADSIKRVNGQNMKYTGLLRVRIIPELLEQLDRVILYMRKHYTTLHDFGSVFGKVVVTYPSVSTFKAKRTHRLMVRIC